MPNMKQKLNPHKFQATFKEFPPWSMYIHTTSFSNIYVEHYVCSLHPSPFLSVRHTHSIPLSFFSFPLTASPFLSCIPSHTHTHTHTHTLSLEKFSFRHLDECHNHINAN